MPGQPITIDPTKPMPVSPNQTSPPIPLNLPVVDVTLATATGAQLPVGTVLTFEVLVTDNIGQTATATAQVTIQGKPTVRITPSPQTVGPNTPVEMTATASSPGGSIASYSWTLTNVAPPKG